MRRSNPRSARGFEPAFSAVVARGSDRACPGRRVAALLDAEEPDSEAGAEPGEALGLHVERIAAAELAERLGVGRAVRRQRRELGEELLEAGGGDDLEDPRRLVAGVPEGVPLPARL
jgi:hypothetical protein